MHRGRGVKPRAGGLSRPGPLNLRRVPRRRARALATGPPVRSLPAVNFLLSFGVTVLMTVLITIGVAKLATGSIWFLAAVLAVFMFLFIRYGCLRH